MIAASSWVPDADAAMNHSVEHRAATPQGKLVFEARGSGSVKLRGSQDLRPQLLQPRGLPFGVAQFHKQWLLSPFFEALHPLMYHVCLWLTVTGIVASSYTNSHTARPVTLHSPSYFIYAPWLSHSIYKARVQVIGWDVGMLGLEPGVWL